MNTVLAALFGDLVMHPWRSSERSESDAYSLFVARSIAMGWLTKAGDGATSGLWGMNDAGQDAEMAGPHSCAAWFQVCLNDPIPSDRLLPVQALLVCAGDVVARRGVLNLEAIQLLLPLQGLTSTTDTLSRPDALGLLAQSAMWFADPASHPRSAVRVTLSTEGSPSVGRVAPEIARWTREFHQSVFTCDSVSLSIEDAVDIRPTPLANHVDWARGDAATFSGTIVEWSLDALGWSAALLAEACRQQGIAAPLSMVIARASRN